MGPIHFLWGHPIDFEAVSEHVGLKEKAQKDMSVSGIKIRLSEDRPYKQPKARCGYRGA